MDWGERHWGSKRDDGVDLKRLMRNEIGICFAELNLVPNWEQNNASW